MAYSGVFVFGDSLVDAGNALKLAQWYDGLPFADLCLAILRLATCESQPGRRRVA